MDGVGDSITQAYHLKLHKAFSFYLYEIIARQNPGITVYFFDLNLESLYSNIIHLKKFNEKIKNYWAGSVLKKNTNPFYLKSVLLSNFPICM